MKCANIAGIILLGPGFPVAKAFAMDLSSKRWQNSDENGFSQAVSGAKLLNEQAGAARMIQQAPIRGIPASAGAYFLPDESKPAISMEIYATDPQGKTHPVSAPFAVMQQAVAGQDGGPTEEFDFPQLRIDWKAKVVQMADGTTVGALVPDRSYPDRPYRVELNGYRLSSELTPQSDPGDGPYAYGSVFLEKTDK